jgi:hypothetical protein
MPTQENTTLKTEYADKVRADLAQNKAEQDRIRTEIETLQAQLATLESDHTLLESMSAALGDDTAAAVPAPRRGRKTASKETTARKTAAAAKTTAAVKKTAAKKTTAAAKKTVVKKTAAKKSGQKPADKVPPLTDLIHEHLSGQSEPRTAREIAKALTDAHPGRNTSDNLVRTTTERLVARSRVERVKQGSTVYYTAIKVGAAPAAAVPAAPEPAEKATAAS